MKKKGLKVLTAAAVLSLWAYDYGGAGRRRLGHVWQYLGIYGPVRKPGDQ